MTGDATGKVRRAYRRGSVFGLTVAEVTVLFVFIILLMVAGPVKREREVSEALEELGLDPTQAAIQRALVSLEAQERAWKVLVPESNTPDGPANDLVTRLAALVEEQADSLLGLHELVDSIRGEGGSDLPSCWFNEDDERVFLFDVALRDDGYWVQVSGQAAELANDFPGPVDPSGATERTLSEPEFIEAMDPHYRWSVEREEECRFFVNVYDETGTSKDLFKQRMSAVEQRFYKRELGGTIPGPAPPG